MNNRQYNGFDQRTVSILGCGWYGLALAKSLTAEGYHVKGSTTSDQKLAALSSAGIEAFLVNFEVDHITFNEEFFNCDVLIISIPPKSKSPTLSDYPRKINNIALAAEKAGVSQLIFISSTGVYQDGNFIVTEDTTPCPITGSGKAMFEAEGILKSNLSFTTTIIRFGGLIGPDRNLAKHFAGKKEISNGLAPINLIHLADCIGITKAIIDQKAFSHIYHGVAPNHPSRKDFYTKACIAGGFEVPSFVDELLDWKQVESKNVTRFLTYPFKIENWMEYAMIKH